MKAMLAWIGYVWMTTWAGLAIHPYQSVRRMVFSQRILLPVTISPIILLAALFIVGRVGSAAFNLYGAERELMAAVLGATMIGLLLWQGLLLALVVRFWRAR